MEKSLYTLDLNGKITISDEAWFLNESPLKLGDLVYIHDASMIVVTPGNVWNSMWLYDVWVLGRNRKTFITLAAFHFGSLRVASRVL